jgi:hypothetical protein
MTPFPRLVAVNGQAPDQPEPEPSPERGESATSPKAEDWARLQAAAERLERLALLLEQLASAVVAEAELQEQPSRPVLTVLQGGRSAC